MGFESSPAARDFVDTVRTKGKVWTDTKTKEQIWVCFLDACARPVYVNQAYAGGSVQMEMGEFLGFRAAREVLSLFLASPLAVC